MAWQPDYVTLAEFKHYLEIDTLDTTDDAELAFAITAGSRCVDRVCSTVHNGLGAPRQFGKVDSSEARYFTPRWDSELLSWVVEIDDLYSAVGLTVDSASGNDRTYSSSVTAYTLRPMNALVDQMVYTQLLINNTSSVQPSYFQDSIRLTSAKWGWSDVPTAVVQATLIQAHRIKKRRVSPMGKSGSPQKGTQQELLEDVDPDVVLILKEYVKLGRTP